MLFGNLMSVLIALVMILLFFGYIVHFARLSVYHEMTYPALAVATVIMGLLLTFLMHSLWGLTLSQFAAVMAGSEALMWILLIISIRGFIRLFYPDVVFKSWLSLKIVFFGRQKLYNSGLIDDLLD